MSDTPSQGFRAGYVVIAGRPNVGKSTLFNTLVGERLSIVTPRPQTTRSNILGILTLPGAQMIFLDTPGLLEPRYRLHEVMVKQIRRAVADADLLLGIVDASDFEPSFDSQVRQAFLEARIPCVIALNKIDLVGPRGVERGLNAIREALPERQVLPVSAHTGRNVAQLRSVLEAALPPGPMFYPEDMLTEHPERFFVAELIREEIFTRLRQELPYATAVRIESFKEDRPKTYIGADIVVERNSQKGIVIGSGGKTLQAIGRSARLKIEAFLERPVYLELRVKVYENWRKKDRALRSFGYIT